MNATQSTTRESSPQSANHASNPQPVPAPTAVPGPVDLLRAELDRLLNLRATWGYAFAYLLFLVGTPVLLWLATRNGPAEFRFEPTFADTLLGADFLTIIAIVFAAAGSAGDIAGRRVAFGYLTSGSRWGVHAARTIAQLILIAVATVVGFVVTSGIFAALGALSAEDFGGAAVAAGLILVWGAIGSGVGKLVPVPAVAVALPIGWILVLEMAVALVPVEWVQTLMEYLPWTATRQLLGVLDSGVGDLHAGLVLAGWCAVVVVGGIVVASRRDVK